MSEVILEDIVVPARKVLLPRSGNIWGYESKPTEARSFRASGRIRPVGQRAHAASRPDLNREPMFPKPQLQKLHSLKHDLVLKHEGIVSFVEYKPKIFEWADLAQGVEAYKDFGRTPIEGTWLTADTVGFVASEVRKAVRASGQAENTLAATKEGVRIVEEAVRGLLHSIASAIADNPEASAEFVLARDKIDSAVAKAILFRAPVDFYQQVSFMASLHKDILGAVSSGENLKGNFWRLFVKDSGALVLTVDRSRVSLELPVIEQWTKAKAIRLSSLK